MDYRCPNCGEDLQYKLTPTKLTGDRAILGFNIYRTPSCRKCGALIEIAHNKEDFKITRILLVPFMIGLLTLPLGQTWLLYISCLAFIVGVVYVAIYISKPSYKNSSYYKIYEKKP